MRKQRLSMRKEMPTQNPNRVYFLRRRSIKVSWASIRSVCYPGVQNIRCKWNWSACPLSSRERNILNPLSDNATRAEPMSWELHRSMFSDKWKGGKGSDLVKATKMSWLKRSIWILTFAAVEGEVLFEILLGLFPGRYSDARLSSHENAQSNTV